MCCRPRPEAASPTGSGPEQCRVAPRALVHAKRQAPPRVPRARKPLEKGGVGCVQGAGAPLRAAGPARQGEDDRVLVGVDAASRRADPALDWTISPFVALYFAAQFTSDRKAWCHLGYCSHRLKDAFEAAHDEIPEFEHPDAPALYHNWLEKLRNERIVIPLTFNYASTERLVAQQGRFTMWFAIESGQDCIGDVVGKHAKMFVIPHDRKQELLLRLREMNITGATLFPGVMGWAVDLRARFAGPPNNAVARARVRRRRIARRLERRSL